MTSNGAQKPVSTMNKNFKTKSQTNGNIESSDIQNTKNENNSTTKKDKNSKFSPVLICSILTVWSIIGVLVGLSCNSVLIMACFMLPVAGYEIYRTKGKSTIFASWALLAVLILEIIFLIFGVSYDLSQYLNMKYTYVAGQYVPIGDIKILGPTLMAVLSLILLLRTAGPYTKWLSVIIIAVALIMVQIMNPEIFKQLLQSAVERANWLF